jgi:hypothetical protein
MHPGFRWRGELLKRTPGRPRRRWECSIKVHLKIEGQGLDWIHLAQYKNKWWAVVNSVLDRQVPYSVGNFLTC